MSFLIGSMESASFLLVSTTLYVILIYLHFAASRETQYHIVSLSSYFDVGKKQRYILSFLPNHLSTSFL